MTRLRAGILAVSVAGFAVLAAIAGSHPAATAPDRTAFDAAHDLAGSTGRAIAKVATALGATPEIAIATIVLAVGLAALGRVRGAIVLAGGSALSIPLVALFKDLVDRPRPPHRLVHVTGASFPSGHATHAVLYAAAAVLAAAVLRPAARRLALAAGFALALAIGLSRVYLHVHFLTDVIAGWALGAAAYLALALGLGVRGVADLRQNARR
jgi:undecaprenyl-diphosphatase